MSFVAGALVPWTLAPDWKNGVRETLAWYTTRLPARSGPAQKRQMRLAPRREFEVDILAHAQERRLLDALLFDRGARVYQLPIWHDVQALGVAATLGDTDVPCDTSGFEFVAGGRALLCRGANAFEIVEIESVETDHIALVDPLTASWGRGTWLYPLRAARVLEASEEQAQNDDCGKRRVTFVVDEPCNWAAVAPTATYRDLPVLEYRTDEADDPRSSYARMIESVDADTGPVAYFDYPDVAFRSTDVQFLLGNRTEHGAFRSLLYWLEGRTNTFWLPSWSSDLRVVAPVNGTRTVITVEWAGYTVFGRKQANRRDIRIELLGGAVHYRRITGAVESGDTELLTIDTALPADIEPSQVRQVSFLTLSEMATDAVELDHMTDAEGITRSKLGFLGVKDDL